MLGETTACPVCGARIAAQTPVDGLCPSCLFVHTLEEAVADDTLPLDERYGILNVLGEGPHGVTYLAQARDTPHIAVAVKILKARRPLDEWQAHLQAYLTVSKGIQCLAIAPVIDVGVTADERGYVVTEFIVGRRLLSHCRRARLDADARLRLLAEVCSVVDGAHRHGLIHGHLVAENVLVTKEADRDVRVMDFGLDELSGSGQVDRHEDLHALTGMVDALLASGEEPLAEGNQWSLARAAAGRAIATCETAGAIAATMRALADEQSAP